ncbi:MAG TPA: hypothetical protein VMZ25_11145 [Terriglobales bacterium]|nr:hypothetical protein [Terriglobales bacterium]
MKKASLMTALVLLMASLVVAQTSTTTTQTPGTTTSQSQTGAGANVTSLTGCLSGPTNGVYTLRTLTDNRTYVLRSDNPLTSHANHAVTVTGSLEGGASGMSSTAGMQTNTSGTNTGTNTAGASSTIPSTSNSSSSTGTTSATSPSASGNSTMNPSVPNTGAPSTAAAGAGATTGAGAQSTMSAGANAPVFRVTSVSMANESCEAGSAAIGTGASTTGSINNTTPSSTSTTGTSANQTATGSGTSVSGQTTTTGNQTASGTGTSVSGQTSTSGNQTASGTSGSGQNTGSNMAGAEGTTLTGCLLASTRDAGRYFLRTTKGKKHITEVIPSSALSADFSQHVGHQVRLTGQFSDTMAANSTGDTMAHAGNLPQTDQPSAGRNPNVQDHNAGRQFTASNVEMVSARGCPQSTTAPNNDRSSKSKAKSKSKTKTSTDDTTTPQR